MKYKNENENMKMKIWLDRLTIYEKKTLKDKIYHKTIEKKLCRYLQKLRYVVLMMLTTCIFEIIPN